MTTPLPLVYSCSGCSSAAQMANHLALRLDRDAVAEMSRIAGVGGGVTGLTPQRHLVLSEYGVKKRKHADFDKQQADSVYRDQVLPAARLLGTS